MRTVALVVATLLCAACMSATALAVDSSVIGPPPQQSSPSNSSATTAARLQAQYDAALARKQAAFDKQVATYKQRQATYEKQKLAYEARVDELTAQVEELESGSSSSDDQLKSIQEANAAMRSDYAALFESQAEQATKLDEVTAENERLTKRVNQLRPPIARDPLDWLVLAGGLVLGGLIGLLVGIRRGENRATGGPIPENVAAWWGGDVVDKTETQG